MLRQHTELMDRILTSAKARSIVDSHVSPVYGESVVGLWLFQVIGAQLEDIDKWANDFAEQIVPHTATWSLDYWEDEYGLARDPQMTIEKRRMRLLSKIRNRAPMNPVVLARIASVASANAEVEIEERTGKNQFTVWISAFPNEGDKKKVIEAVRRAKPSHLIFNVKYLQHGVSEQYFAGIMQPSYDITMKQVV